MFEQHLLTNCLVLSVGQRCADWFVLRQFRLTATEASKLYMASNEVREQFGYKEKESNSATNAQLLSRFCKSWFSTNRATEAMMRGTVNENAVMNCLKRKAYIAEIFPVGLIARDRYPWLAASPDALFIVEMSNLPEEHRKDGTLPCCVEIKTSVSSASVSSAATLATSDLIICEFGSEMFAEYIPAEHAGQMMHQMICTRVDSVLYVAASESQIYLHYIIMYVVLAQTDRALIRYAQNFILQLVTPVLKWAHEAVATVPSFATQEDCKVIWSRLPFWRCAKTFVEEYGPFPPVRLFRHSSQTFYSKTRGGVDGSAQYRATYRSSTSNMKWEQKLTTHVLKTVTVNGFVAWRMLTKEDLLETKTSFRTLDHYRRALNDLQSLADYTHDLALELLEFAAEVDKAEVEEETTVATSLNGRQITRLRAMARARKRNRIVFFNRPDMSRLRLEVKNHQHIYAAELYCALCGQNRDAAFRGHRTVIKCSFCDVHLCLKVQTGLQKSCWNIWHNAKKLRPRTPLAVSGVSPDPEDDQEDDGDPGTEAEDVPAWKRRRVSREAGST